MKLLLSALSLLLANCATNSPAPQAAIPSPTTQNENRKPAQEATPEELAAIQAEIARKPSLPEYNLGFLLGAKLPANVFEAIFGTGTYADRASALSGFKFTGPTIFDQSLKQPVLIFNSGVNMSSSLLAIKHNVFIEGFYRQLDFQNGSFKKLPVPYFKYDPASQSFHYIPDGAQPLLVDGLMMVPGAFDAKTGLVTLYRGTDKAQLVDLQNLRDLLKTDATRGNAEAARLAAKYKNGLFSSNLMATAKQYANSTSPAIITVKIPKAKLDQLVAAGGVYVGYEYRYFELSFLSAAAFAEYAKDMVATN